MGIRLMDRGVLGLIGAGAVGPALARVLAAAGWRVGGIASRRSESARAAVEFLGTGRAVSSNAEAAAGADLLLVAVPDRAIAEVAAEVAAAGTLPRGALALHCSGALSSDALAPLRAAGAAVGSIHPLQSFADAASAAIRLRESFVFFEGDDPARVRAVADDLSPRAVAIRREGKTLYHAGAAAACNLALSMVDVGVRLFLAAGIGRTDALEALRPLLAGTLQNLADVGLPAALTGPVSRGDVATVAAHVAAIRAHAPDLLAPYVEGSRHAIRIGREKGTLSPEAAALLARVLGD